LAESRPQLMHVRGKGLMVGFDVVRDAANPICDATVGRGVEDFCRARGVNLEVIQRNRFRILPPLTISKEEIDRFLSVLDDALAAVARGEAAPITPTNIYSAEYDRRAKGPPKTQRCCASLQNKATWNCHPSREAGKQACPLPFALRSYSRASRESRIASPCAGPIER